MPQSFLTNGDLSFGYLSSLAFSLDVNSLLSGVHLDVGLRRKIRADSAVSSVGSSAPLSSSIDLDVVNGKFFHIFGIGVSFDVVNETQDNSD